jgi:hypothetical protein
VHFIFLCTSFSLLPLLGYWLAGMRCGAVRFPLADFKIVVSPDVQSCLIFCLLWVRQAACIVSGLMFLSSVWPVFFPGWVPLHRHTP